MKEKFRLPAGFTRNTRTEGGTFYINALLKGGATIVRKVEFDFVKCVKIVLRSGHGAKDIELGALGTVFPDLVYQALIIIEDFPYKMLGISGRIRFNDEVVVVVDDALNGNLIFGHTLKDFVVS